MVTCDGGGKWIDDRPCFGAGLVASVYQGGVAHRLAELALPLYKAESAQEAEAAAGWEAVIWREHALQIAVGRGFDPSPPDVLYGDSANTAGAMEGRVRLRAQAPNRWALGMREVTATQTRGWMVIDVPRSMNKAADCVATTAWHLVRDVRSAGPRLQRVGHPWLQPTDGVALSTAFAWVQVLLVFAESVEEGADVERLPWRLRLSEHFQQESYSQLRPSTLGEPLPQVEWALASPEWSHEALYYALIFMPSHGNRIGQRFYRGVRFGTGLCGQRLGLHLAHYAGQFRPWQSARAYPRCADGAEASARSAHVRASSRIRPCFLSSGGVGQCAGKSRGPDSASPPPAVDVREPHHAFAAPTWR